jgi:hypothetical protein
VDFPKKPSRYGLVTHLDAAIVKANARLKTKASLSAASSVLPVVALALALANI